MRDIEFIYREDDGISEELREKYRGMSIEEIDMLIEKYENMSEEEHDKLIEEEQRQMQLKRMGKNK